MRSIAEVTGAEYYANFFKIQLKNISSWTSASTTILLSFIIHTENVLLFMKNMKKNGNNYSTLPLPKLSSANLHSAKEIWNFKMLNLIFLCEYFTNIPR